MAVFTGQLDWLATKIVQLREDPLTNPQLVALMKERLKPIRDESVGSKQKVCHPPHA